MEFDTIVGKHHDEVSLMYKEYFAFNPQHWSSALFIETVCCILQCGILQTFIGMIHFFNHWYVSHTHKWDPTWSSLSLQMFKQLCWLFMIFNKLSNLINQNGWQNLTWFFSTSRLNNCSVNGTEFHKLGINSLGINSSLPEKKWPPFRRQHFQVHFLEWKC